MATRPIPGYEDSYYISSEGRVFSKERRCIGRDGKTRLYREKEIKPVQKESGYCVVTLHAGGKQRTFYVHRLMASAFLPNADCLPQVNHKNENKADNQLENLEWCTGKYNSNYGTGRARRSQKMRKCITGKNRNGETRTFESITHAAMYFGVSINAISQALRKGFPFTCSGYYWEYQTTIY